MLARPWPIKILFLFHFFAPFFNLIFNAWTSDSSIVDFFSLMIEKNTKVDIFFLFAALPLAGIVIFVCKRWSYYTYLGLMAGVFLYNYSKWQEHPHLFEPVYVLSFFAVNLSVVGYFLIPAVRSLYFDERLRWWEAEPRYIVGLRGEILMAGTVTDCEIENISKGGARLRVEEEFEMPPKITLRFTFEEKIFAVSAVCRQLKGRMLSVEFEHSGESREKLNEIVQKSFAREFDLRGKSSAEETGFFGWLLTLFKTGKGLVPKNPNELSRKKKLKKTVGKGKAKKKTKKL